MMDLPIYEFYCQMMTKDEQDIYRAMYEGFRDYADHISVPVCTNKKISEIYEKIKCDHPEIFYIRSIKIRTRTKGMMKDMQVIPAYRFTQEEIRFLSEGSERETAVVIHLCSGESTVRKEQIIHDYIVNKVTYKDPEAPYSHQMPGVFLYGIGVCEGISKAFKYLCDKTGIKSGIVIGNTKSETTLHAWTMVCIDGNWYNIDVTYDANLSKYSGDMRYDYFNVADKEISDRKPLYSTHECMTHFGFYKRENRYASCRSELKKLLKNYTGEKISVQIPRLDCPDKEISEKLLDVAIENISSNGRMTVKVYPNYKMGVYTISSEVRV